MSVKNNVRNIICETKQYKCVKKGQYGLLNGD